MTFTKFLTSNLTELKTMQIVLKKLSAKRPYSLVHIYTIIQQAKIDVILITLANTYFLADIVGVKGVLKSADFENDVSFFNNVSNRKRLSSSQGSSSSLPSCAHPICLDTFLP